VIKPDGSLQQVPAGTAGGRLNWPLFLGLAKRRKPWATIVLENTSPETLPASVSFVRDAWAAA
jgi:hypothetical protein